MSLDSSSDRSIVIDRLSVRYRAIEALRDVNLVLAPGQLTGIVGPNGAGKSTLMKAMLGLVPSWGTVAYGDRPLQDSLDRVAYVPQRSQIDWTYPATVWDVVMMGRTRRTGWFRPFSAVSKQRAAAALERVGMGAFRDRRIGDLSGGQQQRVFLARSLAQEADVYCFDEPMAGIDRLAEAVLFQIFGELAAAGHHVLVVHHDLGESIARFERLILLNREVIAAGNRSEVLTDEHLHRAYGGRVSYYTAA